jgi:hypothetical protein
MNEGQWGVLVDSGGGGAWGIGVQFDDHANALVAAGGVAMQFEGHEVEVVDELNPEAGTLDTGYARLDTELATYTVAEVVQDGRVRITFATTNPPVGMDELMYSWEGKTTALTTPEGRLR